MEAEMAETSLSRQHPIATAFGWLFALISTGLTVLWVVGFVSMLSEWSDYVGNESSTALIITGVVALVTAVAWTITWVTFSSRRR
jgi:hypothetical protein